MVGELVETQVGHDDELVADFALPNERFAADVQAAEPEVVTIQFGLNDCNRWESDRGLPRVSPRAFAANLVEMIERARAFGAREIVLATNHRTLRPAEYERDNAYYSELTREVATEAGAHLCDIRSAFEPFSEQELAELLLPAPDILHLSVAGNRVYADAIEPFVKRAVAAAAGIGPEVARA
jgi:lysophospholipase L1-like esterase